MAKSGKKRKKAEKSKTKLRQSIKLPKGLNETNTTIAAKKIQVLNQLKSGDGSDDRLTRKKIGIKDLISKLSNNGTSIKVEGLEGIEELVKAHPEICSEHLSKLITTIFPLTVHFESKIRSNARSVISLIVNRVTANQISSLINVISAHLCCGLSHIDSDIQLDSLKLLDSIVEAAPNVAVEGHQQLLPNCLDQVSLKSKESRALSKNVSGKISALQWRTDVLQRVLMILTLVFETDKKDKNEVPRTNFSSFYHPIPFDEDVEMISIQDVTNGRFSSRKELENGFSLSNFKVGLLSILLDTWCEAVSMSVEKQANRASSGLVSSAILPTLTVIVKLLLVTENSNDKLLKQVVKNFPYEVSQAPMDRRQKQASSQASQSVNARELNLDICNIWFLQSNLNDSSREDMERLLSYLSNFDPKNTLEAGKVSVVIKMMARNEEMLKSFDLTNLDKIVQRLTEKFNYNEKVTQALLQLSISEKLRSHSVEKWVKGLASIIISGKAGLHHLEAVGCLYKRRDVALFDSFKNIQTIDMKVNPKSPHLYELAWRSLVLFPEVMEKKKLLGILEDASLPPNTLSFCKNMLELNC